MAGDMHSIPELDSKGYRNFALTTGGIVACLFGLFFPWLLERPLPRETRCTAGPGTSPPSGVGRPALALYGQPTLRVVSSFRVPGSGRRVL